MPTVNRLTLAEEFYDVTSSVVLRAPEPQFLYAVLWKMAFKRGLDRKMGGLGLMPGRLAGGEGAPFPDVQQFEMQLDDPIIGDAFVVVPNSEAKVGHTVRMNRPRFTDSTYTQAAREVTRKTISTTPSVIGSEQVALTIKQFAGPYDNGQSAVAPIGLDAFDASRAVHDLGQEVGTHLQRDFDKTLDAFISALLDAGDSANTVWATDAISTDDAYASANSAPMSYDMLIRARRNLRKAKVPTFSNGKYVCVIGPDEEAALAEDDDWLRQSVFDKQANPLIGATYLKSIQGAMVYTSQTLNTANNSSSVPVRRNHMFGPGAIGGIVVPVSGQGGPGPRVASASDDNYGLTAKVIWLLEGGLQLFDSRFVATLRTA